MSENLLERQYTENNHQNLTLELKGQSTENCCGEFRGWNWLLTGDR